jgi:hypothetical protein
LQQWQEVMMVHSWFGPLRFKILNIGVSVIHHYSYISHFHRCLGKDFILFFIYCLCLGVLTFMKQNKNFINIDSAVIPNGLAYKCIPNSWKREWTSLYFIYSLFSSLQFIIHYSKKYVLYVKGTLY